MIVSVILKSGKHCICNIDRKHWHSILEVVFATYGQLNVEKVESIRETWESPTERDNSEFRPC